MDKENIFLSIIHLKTSSGTLDTLEKFLNKSIESDNISITHRIKLIKEHIEKTVELLEEYCNE